MNDLIRYAMESDSAEAHLIAEFIGDSEQNTIAASMDTLIEWARMFKRKAEELNDAA